MRASKQLLAQLKQQKLPSSQMIRAYHDVALLSINPISVSLLTAASPPSPSIPSQPPIFLSPSGSFPASPSPSPLPATLAASHSHGLPKAAIIGGSVAGAAVALAITATVVSGVAGKVGLSCILAPLLNLLTSFCSNVSGPCAKLNSFCTNIQAWNRKKKDGSDDNKTGDAHDKEANPDIDLFEVLGVGRSPEAVAKAEAAAAMSYSLAKSPLRHNAIKAHGDQFGTSAQAFLAAQVSDFAEGELKKQKEFMMQPLNNNMMKAHEYFESLYSATHNASDELSALKSSAHNYLQEASKLKASPENLLGREDMILTFDEVMKGGAERIKNSTIAKEYAAEMERLQKLRHHEAIIVDDDDEVVMMNRALGKSPHPTSSLNTSGEAQYHHEQGSKQGNINIHAAAIDAGHANLRRGPMCIVETVSDASDIREEADASIVSNQGGMRQQYTSGMSGLQLAEVTDHKLDESTDLYRGQLATSTDNSNMALVTTAAIEGSQGATKPTAAGPIVHVPTKAITPVPTRKMTSIQAARKPTWQLTQQGKAVDKRPTNLGHVSFSCEISAHTLRFFTSCRSGGSYGSPPPSAGHHAARDDHQVDHYLYADDYSTNIGHVGMHQLGHGIRQHDNVRAHGDVTSFSRYPAAFPPVSYGGNNNVGLLASKSGGAPTHLHYYNSTDTQENHETITQVATSTPQSPPPIPSVNRANYSHGPLDYGSPFDGVL